MIRTRWFVILAGVALWALPASAAYINWTGESFVYPASLSATSGCYGARCYASYADGATQSAVLHAWVPQDMPTAGGPKFTKCTLEYYSDGGNNTLKAVFVVGVHAMTVGASVAATQNYGSSTNTNVIPTSANLVKQTDTGQIVLWNQATNAACAADATCIGHGLDVVVTRFGSDGGDDLTASVLVTGLSCEY